MLKRSHILAFCFGACGVAGPALAADAALRPGEWESEMRFTSVQGTGVHASATKAIINKPKTRRECMSAADLDPTLQYASLKKPGCTTPAFSVSGGKINIAGQCSRDGRVQTTKVVGAYTPTTYTTTVTTSLMDGGAATMVHKGRRIGDCATDD